MPANADVEDIIRELTRISDGEVTIAADMWWGVGVKGSRFNEDGVESVEYATWVACDRLKYGLMATYRHWTERYAERTGRAWQPWWEDKR